MKTVTTSILLLIVTVAGWTQTKPDSVLVWPVAPDRPKIKFVETLSATQFSHTKSGFFSKFVNMIFGGDEQRAWLIQPVGIAVSAKGQLLVADPGAHGVYRLNRVEREYEFFHETKEGPFESPVGIATADDGTIYVSDTERHEIMIFDDEMELQRVIRDNLLRPTGVAIRGNLLYVTDTGKHKIVVFELNGKYLYDFGERGIGQSTFNFPVAAAAWRDGLYIVDAVNYRIQHTDSSGKFISAFGKQGNAAGSFASPKSTALDSDGNIYVTDALMDNFQIFSREGELQLVVGHNGEGSGQFQSPNGIAIDQSDNIYVVDMLNRRIEVFHYIK